MCPIGHYGALWSTVSYWPLWGAVMHCVLLATRGRRGALQILATRWRYGAQRSIGPYEALWGSPTSPLFPPQNNQGKVEPMGYNALLSTRGRCAALCPMGHYGALWCTVSDWPRGGVVMHCVLLATMGRCGAICSATTLGAVVHCKYWPPGGALEHNAL